MQNDLASAQTELNETAARLQAAERALATDTSPTAWKAVTSLRDASDKAATRVRVLESLAAEDAAKAAVREREEAAAELARLEARETLPLADDADLAAFDAAIASLTAIAARVGQRIASRLVDRDTANAIRESLGKRPRNSPGPTVAMGLFGSNAKADQGDRLTEQLQINTLKQAIEAIAGRESFRVYLRSKRNELAQRRARLIEARDGGHKREIAKREEALTKAEATVAMRKARLEVMAAAMAEPTNDDATKFSREQNHAEAFTKLRNAEDEATKARAALEFQRNAKAEESAELLEVEEQIAAWAQPGGVS